MTPRPVENNNSDQSCNGERNYYANNLLVANHFMTNLYCILRVNKTFCLFVPQKYTCARSDLSAKTWVNAFSGAEEDA
jgi:hypothetical protein